MNNLTAYIIYLLIATILTVFVGKNLHSNGYYLILDLFENEVFTRTVNNLLLTGYYLVNLGYVAITITSFPDISSSLVLLEVLASKLGAITLILGSLHFNNIIILHFLSSRKQNIIQLFNN